MAIEDGTVRYRWKDYRQQRRLRAMRLAEYEFIRHLPHHVLQRDFHRNSDLAVSFHPTTRFPVLEETS